MEKGRGEDTGEEEGERVKHDEGADSGGGEDREKKCRNERVKEEGGGERVRDGGQVNWHHGCICVAAY